MYLFIFGCTGSYLWHAGFFIVVCWFQSVRAQLTLSMWGLSFLTRDQAFVTCMERWILNKWTIREVPKTILEDLLIF